MADVRTTTIPDAKTAPEAPPSPTHVAIRREDYRPPDWLVPEIRLDFDLDLERTRVRATLEVERNGEHDRPLRLDGDELNWFRSRSTASRRTTGSKARSWSSTIAGDRATVETEVDIRPAANTKLMGLYASSGMLCTQCEAEGFRRITFFPDRPDVLSKYRVRMEGRRARFPGAAVERQPRRRGRSGRRVATGPNGRTPSPSPAICSRSLPATSRPTATASRP